MPNEHAASLRLRWLCERFSGEAGCLMAFTQVVFYRDQRGRQPVDVFIGALPDKVAAKLADAIDEHLNGRSSEAPPPPFPNSSQVTGELRELRVRFARTRYRVLYQRSGNLIVLLHAFEKHTGAAPRADVDLAVARMADFTRCMNRQPRKPPRAAGDDAP